MKTIAIIAIAGLVAAPAFAQQSTTPAAPVEPAEIFAAIDTDKNGSLSLTEVQAQDSRVTEADFGKYDADGNKALNATEFEAWIKASADAKATHG
jgi:Skp family chaperone for outer membrane proteins